MKRTLINTAAGALAAVLLGSASLAHANPYQVGSQQWHNYNATMQSEADRIQRERNATQQQQPEYRGDYQAPIQRDTTPRSLQYYHGTVVNFCIEGLNVSDTGLSRGQINRVCNCVYDELAKQFPSSQEFLRILEAERFGQLSSREKRDLNSKMDRAVETCVRPYVRR